jgi:hypothetical protein
MPRTIVLPPSAVRIHRVYRLVGRMGVGCERLEQEAIVGLSTGVGKCGVHSADRLPGAAPR